MKIGLTYLQKWSKLLSEFVITYLKSSPDKKGMTYASLASLISVLSKQSTNKPKQVATLS